MSAVQSLELQRILQSQALCFCQKRPGLPEEKKAQVQNQGGFQRRFHGRKRRTAM